MNSLSEEGISRACVSKHDTRISNNRSKSWANLGITRTREEEAAKKILFLLVLTIPVVGKGEGRERHTDTEEVNLRQGVSLSDRFLSLAQFFGLTRAHEMCPVLVQRDNKREE